MSKRVVRSVVHNVARGEGFNRVPSCLVSRRGVQFFQVWLPRVLAQGQDTPPLRIRLGRIPEQDAQRHACGSP